MQMNNANFPLFYKASNIYTTELQLPDKLIELIIEELTNDIEEAPLIPGKLSPDPRVNPLHPSISSSDSEGNEVKSVRDCELQWINALDKHGWVTGLIWYHIYRINETWYNYDIRALERLQLTSYSKGEFYNWHVDSHHLLESPEQSLVERKLTVSLQLSDESDYEGGELQILHPGHKGLEKAPKGKGTLTIFDSRLAHRVKPVTKGRRLALVCWAIGPGWR